MVSNSPSLRQLPQVRWLAVLALGLMVPLSYIDVQPPEAEVLSGTGRMASCWHDGCAFLCLRHSLWIVRLRSASSLLVLLCRQQGSTSHP